MVMLHFNGRENFFKFYFIIFLMTPRLSKDIRCHV